MDPDPPLEGLGQGRTPLGNRKQRHHSHKKSLSIPAKFRSVVPSSCRRPAPLDTGVARPTCPGLGSRGGAVFPWVRAPLPAFPVRPGTGRVGGARPPPSLLPGEGKTRESRPRFGGRWNRAGLRGVVSEEQAPHPAVLPRITPQALGSGGERMLQPAPPGAGRGWRARGPGGGGRCPGKGGAGNEIAATGEGEPEAGGSGSREGHGGVPPERQ